MSDPPYDLPAWARREIRDDLLIIDEKRRQAILAGDLCYVAEVEKDNTLHHWVPSRVEESEGQN